MIKNLFKKFSVIPALVTVAAFCAVVGITFAATTIGTNINTGGTLDVTGVSTFTRATSTSATSTAYLYVGVDVTEPAGWNFDGDLLVSDDVFFNSQATSSASHWVGSGGTATNINLAGGDLYVQNDAEIDGAFYVTGASTLTGNVTMSGTATVAGNATSSGYLVIGTTNPQNNMAAGDLLVGNNATTTGDLVVSGGDLNKDATALTIGGATSLSSTLSVTGASTLTGNVSMGAEASTTDFFLIGNNLGNDDDALYFDIGRNESLLWDDAPGEFDLSDDLNISGKATTTGVVAGSESTAATTTVQIKADGTGGNGSSCLEMVDVEGTLRHIYLDGAGAVTVGSGACI